MTSSTWVRASPSPWFDDGDGHVANLGARALVARGFAGGVEQAVERIRERVVGTGVDPAAVTIIEDRIRLDARALPTPVTAQAFEVLASRARARPTSGVVLVGGVRRQVPGLGHEIGADALTWAWLRCARPQAHPPSLEPGVHVLGTRTDDNPLALVRRAHARLQTQTTLIPDPGDALDGSSTPGAVATASALVEQGALTSVETGRCGPVCLAIEALARVSLRAVESETSETRTDLPWAGPARTVLAGALAAAGVAAPVPY